MDDSPYVRPPTPQTLLHRAPDKPDASDVSPSKPNKYIILLLAPTSVPGKVQIAISVSKSLSCPLFQGDSLHESSAKAATVGASRSGDGGRGRYQRMWLSKMTRTGLLFPEESRPANEGFSGFGGGSPSTSTSRRGSRSSISSTTSLGGGSVAGSTASSVFDTGNQFLKSGGSSGISQKIKQHVFTLSEAERLRRSNPALMVLTHPELEQLHKDAICQATGEHRIGIIFVPLFDIQSEHDDDVEDEDEDKDDLLVLKPLDPEMISQFTSFDALRAAAGGARIGKALRYGKGKEGSLKEEMVLKVDVKGNVEDIIEEIVSGVKDVVEDVMGAIVGTLVLALAVEVSRDESRVESADAGYDSGPTPRNGVEVGAGISEAVTEGEAATTEIDNDEEDGVGVAVGSDVVVAEGEIELGLTVTSIVVGEPDTEIVWVWSDTTVLIEVVTSALCVTVCVVSDVCVTVSMMVIAAVVLESP
ncbi:hypothetical protein MMC25_003919 [Agyrium rufum]|nr:hypothetical protein [Agyrium rufum]